MTIKSDRWIRRMAAEHHMIEPFEAGQVREVDGRKIVSYGTSSYGYDVRCAREFKVFTNINSTIVDPKTFDARSFVDVEGDSCIIPPNSFALARTVEWFRIPRNVLVVCLGKSTYARCFSGETQVALVDGTSPTFLELIERAERGERLFGYSMAPSGRVHVAELVAPRLIGHEDLIEVTLDDGSVIECTPDHEFLLRDGSLSRADALSHGSSLMPLYRSAAQAARQATYWKDNESARAASSERSRDMWAGADARKTAQSELMRNLKLRSDVTEEAVRAALAQMGTIRGAASLLKVDRSAFRRFPALMEAFRAQAPHNHKVEGLRRLAGTHPVYCLTAPEFGNFALSAGVFVKNCGIICNVTPLEPEWEGHVTLEFSNTTPLPARIYAGEGVAQMIFHEADEPCETSYRDRGGKYQGQRGVTLPTT